MRWPTIARVKAEPPDRYNHPMPRLPRTRLLELTLRFLMIAVCALPWPGLRALAGTLPSAPVSAPVSAPSPVGQLPTAPVSEEEENERAEDAKHRAGQRVEYRPDPPRIAPQLPAATSIATTRVTSSDCPSPADPFRNGLGTPYRC